MTKVNIFDKVQRSFIKTPTTGESVETLRETYLDNQYDSHCEVPEDNFEKRVKNLREYGFSDKQIKKLSPTLTLRCKNVNKTLLNLEEYGFGKDGVIKMVVRLPAILSYTSERTNSKLQNLEEYGFGKDGVIKMVVRLPAIIGCSIKRTRKHLELFREIEFDVRTKPGLFVPSPDMLRARVNFLRSEKNMKNEDLPTYLNYKNKKFKKQFGISRDELMRDYQ